jgi:hypothetical protein
MRTPDVVQRLRDITVDPETVVLREAVDVSSIGAPKPAHALQTRSTDEP